jgi:hypothetical protein
MNPDEIEQSDVFSEPGNDELSRLRRLYAEAHSAYRVAYAEWDEAYKEARKWRDREQSANLRQRAMEVAVSNLFTAIKALEEIE